MRLLCLLMLLVGVAQSGTIIQQLNFLGRFSTLLELIKNAGLTDTLSRGLFTLFAPTDSAFSKLPPNLLANLSESQEALQQVLLYHVAPRKIFRTSFENDGLVTTLQGVPVRTNLYQNNLVTVNGFAVNTLDMDTSNGVIHVMDDVIYPAPPTSTIGEVLASDPRFTTLMSAVTAAGLAKTVAGKRPVTFFAPTNEAFEEVNGLSDLLANKEAIRMMLQRHILSGTVFSLGINNEDAKFTLLGNKPEDELEFTVTGKHGHNASIHVVSEAGEADVIQPDIVALNGVIHVIDTVI